MALPWSPTKCVGLAQRTQKSTEEIEGLVAGLQNGTQQVASVMNNSRSLTDSSVELTRKAGVSLENITRTVSNIQSMNQQIAAGRRTAKRRGGRDQPQYRECAGCVRADRDCQ